VSIVVPCYITLPAQLQLLDETLSTVDAQGCDDYEVVVVDDGSPIEPTRMVAAHPRTFTIRQPNGGPAVARNAGIDLARGRTFVFLDADDHLLPGALETALAELDAHQDCGFVVGPHEEMTCEGAAVPGTVAPPPPHADLYLALLGGDWSFGPPSSAIFRRDVVEALGGFRDPWGADDLDFYLRAAYRFTAHGFQAPAVTRCRRYGAQPSRDAERMLHSIRAVYDRQWSLVRGWPEAEAAYGRGLARLTDPCLDGLVESAAHLPRAGHGAGARQGARLPALEGPQLARVTTVPS
jgi:glycosyltransferase involved in cell wall biosynthesis